MRIGIMGGTFDPPHLGHVVPVDDAARQFQLDQVWFVPNSSPPHKTHPRLTDSYHRAAMVALAIQRYPGFLLNTFELNAQKAAYTFDTVRELRAGVGSGHALFFILGTDSFLELDTWYRYEELIGLCEFIIINRGHTEEELNRNLKRLEVTLQKNLTNTFHFCRSACIPVSSSEIRAAVLEGRSIAGWVFPEVEDYIRKHALYQRREAPSD